MAMDKDAFWRIIDEVNQDVPDRNPVHIETATHNILCFKESQDIAAWSNHLDYYRDLADTVGMYAAACCLNDEMTDEGFADFRMWLISQGKDIYLAALKNPDSLAEMGIPLNTAKFESYAYVALDAYDTWDPHGDIYRDKGETALSPSQKSDIRAEIEYYPHEITKDNAENHLPNLYAKYLISSIRILPEGYQPSSNAPTEQLDGKSSTSAGAGMDKSAIQRALRDKLVADWLAYSNSYLDYSPHYVFTKAREIAATEQIYKELVDGSYSTDLLEYLLRFEHPLYVARDQWLHENNVAVDEEVTHALWSLMDRRDAEQDYALDPEYPATDPHSEPQPDNSQEQQM